MAAFGDSQDFPSFFTSRSGHRAPWRVANASDAAAMIGRYFLGTFVTLESFAWISVSRFYPLGCCFPSSCSVMREREMSKFADSVHFVINKAAKVCQKEGRTKCQAFENPCMEISSLIQTVRPSGLLGKHPSLLFGRNECLDTHRGEGTPVKIEFCWRRASVSNALWSVAG